MQGTTNKHISRLLKIITDDSPSLRQAMQRVAAIYGISVVSIVVKWRRMAPQEKLAMLQRIFSNATLTVVLFNGFPLVSKITGNRFISFNTLLLIYSTGEIPLSVTSYVMVESVADWLQNFPSVEAVLRSWDDHTCNALRQGIFCLIIPMLYHARKSRARDLIFRRKSFIKDFALLYSLWNAISLYQYLKSSLYKGNSKQKRKSVESINEQATYPPNSRFLVDKLKEIRELKTSKSILETITSCCFGENLTVSFKWAVWRQLLWLLFKTPSSLCSHMQASITLMIGFLILDGAGDHMNIRPGVLKYLIRCVVSDRLSGSGFEKSAFMVGADLSYYNYFHSNHAL